MKLWFHKPYGPMGYAWLFPLNDKLANIGIGIMGGQKIDMKELLDQYIKNEIKDDYKILSTFRSCVPIAAPLNRVYKDNVMITGDAARLTNSLTAGGIRYAFISGSLSGIVASKYINKEINSLELYQSNLNKKIKSLTKIHNKKRIMEKEEKFIKIYSRIFSLAYNLNRIAPNLSQNYLFNSMRKDWNIINSIK
jgi:flavin-dependent dehydrogenase